MHLNGLKKDGIIGMEYLRTGKYLTGYNLELILFPSFVHPEMVKSVKPFGYCLHKHWNKFDGFILALQGDIEEIERYCKQEKRESK